MLRVLFTRRWLTALAVAALFFTACLFLGRWQWGRHVEKSTAANLVESHYTAAPVPLEDALPSGAASLPGDQVWRRVEMTGRYDTAHRFMVRNRPQNVTYGYEVLVPFVPANGRPVLVDRGWVKNGERADVLPPVPDEPAGEVTVVGWLRPGEAALDNPLPAGQLASIDIDRAARESGHDLRPAFVLLDSERTADGRTPERPTPLIPPSTDTGPHFAYALQWWGASIVGFVLVFVHVRREYEDSLAEAGGVAPRPARVKKTRIWDEEDG